MPLYEMTLEFQSQENRANAAAMAARKETDPLLTFQRLDRTDTAAQSRTILFSHPEQPTGNYDDESTPLEAAFRFWRNRHATWPELFHRLCCVKVYAITPQEIGADGYLPPNHGMWCLEWKYDWPMAGQPCPDNLNPERKPIDA